MAIEIKYPIYVISKGRHGINGTCTRLTKDGVPFKLVVEPQEFSLYKARNWACEIIQTPFSNLGLGGIPARNFVWESSLLFGAKKHWILDDNIRVFKTFNNGRRVDCNARDAFVCAEKFVDRYDNIAIAALNYDNFAFVPSLPPFYLNRRAYSCLLIRNDLPFRWRGRYNEDTDLCLQALTNNWCTVLINAFLIEKKATMLLKGGNTDELYKGRGRLEMARSLEHAWKHIPGLVTTTRKWGRPQHHVNWKYFKTPLKKIQQ